MTSLTAQILLLLAMVGVSVYGAASLPATARVPIHLGIGGYHNWVAKWIGLILWPGIGIGLDALLHAFSAADTGGESAMKVILPIALAVLLITQIGALRAARGNAT